MSSAPQKAMIRVQNIYYMLAYAYRSLNSSAARQYGCESFEHILDLFGTVLANGLAKRVKQGLARDYVSSEQVLSCPRGRICLSDTLKLQEAQKKAVCCSVDEYVENTYANQVLKSVSLFLLKSPEIRPETRSKLKKALLCFQGVDVINLRHVRWSSITYNRNNTSYRLLLNLCRLIVDGMLVTEEHGKTKLQGFVGDQTMNELYEAFVREYYRKNYPWIRVTRSQIPWNIESGSDTGLLPVMRSDVMLEYEGRTLIIDAKYYSSSLNERFSTLKLHSENLYQIYTYVKNKDVRSDKSVSGLLLYARTDGLNPDEEYIMDGSHIIAKSLNLDCDFSIVQSQLGGIVTKWLEKS